MRAAERGALPSEIGLKKGRKDMCEAMRKISFVIPCYGSEHTIRHVVEGIRETVREQDEYEIILVNDCSPDHVWEKIQELCREDEKIKGICLSRNFGQHAALLAGYRQCSGELIVSLDDDGQTPVEEAYRLIDEAASGTDVAMAFYPNKMHNKFRNIGSRINQIMAVQMVGMPKDIINTSYFCMHRFVLEEMLRYENAYPYIPGLICRATKNIKNVAIDHREREYGHSGYTIGKLLGLWFNGFTAFSIKPLRVATIVGCLCALAGFIFGFVTIIRKLVDPNMVLGWSSLVSLIVFIGGMIMLMLGLIGEYIGRIYICINNSPQYVIKEKINVRERENKDNR